MGKDSAVAGRGWGVIKRARDMFRDCRPGTREEAHGGHGIPRDRFQRAGSSQVTFWVDGIGFVVSV